MAGNLSRTVFACSGWGRWKQLSVLVLGPEVITGQSATAVKTSLYRFLVQALFGHFERFLLMELEIKNIQTYVPWKLNQIPSLNHTRS